MASSDRRTRRGSLAAFRRPVVTDLVFWLAAGLAVVFGLVIAGLLLMIVGLPGDAIGWIWPAGTFAITGWLAFKLLAMGINTSRALEPGREPTNDARAQSMEATGRVAGAVVGKGVRKVVGGRRSARPASTPAAPTTPTPPAAEPNPPAAEPSPAAEPTPPVTVDKAARVLGSMVGRRLGDRRKNEGT